MALSHVVYQDPNIKSIDQRLQLGIVSILILAEIHGEDLDVDVRACIFLLDFGGEGLEF